MYLLNLCNLNPTFYYQLYLFIVILFHSFYIFYNNAIISFKDLQGNTVPNGLKQTEYFFIWRFGRDFNDSENIFRTAVSVVKTSLLFIFQRRDAYLCHSNVMLIHERHKLGLIVPESSTGVLRSYKTTLYCCTVCNLGKVFM